jgi:uncharacterized protein YecA (UPF0149 family)
MTKEKREVNIIVGNGSPLVTQTFSRNSKCRCGSGKKTKNCCGEPTKYFHTKANQISEPKRDENHE